MNSEMATTPDMAGVRVDWMKDGSDGFETFTAANSSATLTPERILHAPDILVLAVQSLVTLLVAVGNAAVIVTIARTAELRTVSSMFVVSLATADLLIAMVMPFRLATSLPTLNPTAQDDRWLCVGKLSSLFVLVFAHFYCMLAMAADRCLFIGRPLHYRRLATPARAGAIIALTWAFAVLAGTVPLYNHTWSSGECECDRVLGASFRQLVILPSFALACVGVAAASVYIFAVARRHLRAIRRSQGLLRRQTKQNAAKTFSSVLPFKTRFLRMKMTFVRSNTASGLALKSGAVEEKVKYDVVPDAEGADVPSNPALEASERQNLNSRKNSLDDEAYALTLLGTHADLSDNHDKHCSEPDRRMQYTTLQVQNEGVAAAKPSPSPNSGNDRRRTSRLYLLVFGTFVACWTPTLGCLVAAQVEGLPRWAEQPWNALALFNSALNVVIHVSHNRELRAALLAALRPGKRQPGSFARPAPS